LSLQQVFLVITNVQLKLFSALEHGQADQPIRFASM
jgi:hypothetical protein